jgi:S-adenosylmethionine hydrolase
MQIITLTSDSGYKDHYVASMKGTIISLFSAATIVDISHEIRPFDIAEAAFQLRNCFNDFPIGTLHVIGVDAEPHFTPGADEGSYPSILKYKGQYLVSNDNGFFGAFLDLDHPEEFYRVEGILESNKHYTFPTKQILIPIACKILNGDNIKSFAVPRNKYKKALTPSVLIEKNVLKGYVVHIDAFGNLITNIQKQHFERYEKDVPYTIYFRNKEYFIEQVSLGYNAVPPGDMVAIFNENELLEIAINRGANSSNGGAQQLFGVRVGDMIRVEFTPRGSHDNFDSLFS